MKELELEIKRGRAKNEVNEFRVRLWDGSKVLWKHTLIGQLKPVLTVSRSPDDNNYFLLYMLDGINKQDIQLSPDMQKLLLRSL
ncbi:hypothetical protein SADUNF_Sadunf17G0113800 [Salix dunnii]|uniref:Uncharacterized protein n=1 Tax=Salix dunnii TaxID=1413687 RepID=A0A835J760_9ROSI|nr:hypothetical protein SADUNF_Sadunf17G0113800 [Salix dunnii]